MLLVTVSCYPITVTAVGASHGVSPWSLLIDSVPFAQILFLIELDYLSMDCEANNNLNI